MTVPFPESGNYLKAIRESCKSLRERSAIQISSTSIERLLSSQSFTTSFERVSAAHGLNFPLKFASHLDELNFLSVLSLLNFASGYRIPLHEETGRGAWDNIRALVLSMYLTSTTGDADQLSAKGMKSINAPTVAEMMRINVHVERPHPSLPGVTVGELGGPLYELVKLITDVLNTTGERLLQIGYPDLGTFVAECLREGDKVAPESAADMVLERIVRAIPAFQDMAIVNGQPVYCFKKALFLIHAINIRFGPMSSRPFPVPSTFHLPVFTDNVLPSMLIHLGVIDLSGSDKLSNMFPNAPSPEALVSRLAVVDDQAKSEPRRLEEGPILDPDNAYILRAAAIDACELIVDHSGRNPSSLKLTLPDLDMWIWAIAKDRADYRNLPRFVLKDTVFF